MSTQSLGNLNDIASFCELYLAGELAIMGAMENVNLGGGAEIISFPVPKPKRKNAPAWKKPVKFFSSGLFFARGEGEHEIILYLIDQTQNILDTRDATRGVKTDVAGRLQKRAGNTPFMVNYRNVIEYLREYVNWRDIDGYRG